MAKASARKKPPPPEGVSKKDIWEVPYTMMAIPEYEQEGKKVRLNVREDFGDIAEFGENLYHNGVKMPMSGYRLPGTSIYYVTDGERRYRAMGYVYKKYKKDLVAKFLVEPKGGLSTEERIVNLFLSNGGKEFTPMEQAEGVRRLRLETKLSDAAIARKLGLAPAYVSRLGTLLEAPAELTSLIRTGIVKATTAIDEMVADGAKEFLGDLGSGKYDEAIAKAPNKPGAKQAPITKKTIAAVKQKKEEKEEVVNSWGALKAVGRAGGFTTEDPTKLAILKFLKRLIDNDITRAQIERYFK